MRQASAGSPTSPGRLKGKRILITRAAQQAGSLAEQLRALGATVVEIPSIEIRPPRSYEPLDQAIANISRYDWLVLTSVNGVQALLERVGHAGLAPDHLAQVKIAAIGPATRKVLESRGLTVAIMPRQYIAESVVEAMRDQVKGKKVVLVRARVARDVIPEELRNAGAHVDVVEAYETVVPQASRERLRDLLSRPGQRPHAITFTSSSTVRNFLELLGAENKHLVTGVMLASIGPVTSKTLRELGLGVHIEAAEYTIPGLVAALAENL
ncbi:MAG TPA: uroporphyrinogen-III synthase [Terriglobales bacterium]|nr:uroporphyrinogen-III synthase [Terriglobales bacterium]